MDNNQHKTIKDVTCFVLAGLNDGENFQLVHFIGYFDEVDENEVSQVRDELFLDESLKDIIEELEFFVITKDNNPDLFEELMSIALESIEDK